MARENVQAIVPLLPMQRSFLWRNLTSHSSTCDLTLQCTLRGQINLPLLEQAWQQVVESHQALRCSVHWQDLSVPVQVVHKGIIASIKIDHADSTDAEDQDYIDLTKAPAHQLTLTSVSTNACHVKWLLSHVLLDGWSCSLVVNDWLRHYSGLLNGRSVQSIHSMPLNGYNQWLRKQDTSSVLDFWNETIPPQVSLATPLPYDDQIQDSQVSERYAIIRQSIDTNTTEILVNLCKQSGLSINSILQATLGLVLKPVDNNNELVLSSTVSGRQVNVPGIETFVGMLINVMPVIILFNPDLTIREWLLEHQIRFFSSLPHAHVNLPDLIETRIDVSKGATTQPDNSINCLLVVENQAIATSSNEVTVSDYRSGIVSEMDLTLLVIPTESLDMEIRYRTDKLNDSKIKDILDRLIQLLTSLPSLMEKPLSATENFQSAKISSSFTVHKQQYCSIRNDIDSNERNTQNELQPLPLVEKQLNDIWQQVFGYSVDVDAAFFEIGGDSLQAVRLFALIEKHMGCCLPATTLFTAPTIKMLASVILDNNAAVAGQNVVGINTDGKNPPLFIPFEQSDMLLYRHLIDALGVDQPVYGLQTSQTPLQDDSEIDTLIQTILTLHPDGPYLLAGLSGSGLSAWTIANKLESLGHEVAMLGLLDTYGPDYPRLPPPWTTLLRVSSKLVREGLTFGRRQLIKRLTRNNSQGAAANSKTNPSEQFQEQSVFAKRLAEDRQNAVKFAKSIVRSEPFSERLPLVTAVRIASFNVRSFGLKMELLLLIQGLMLRYRQRDNINAMDKLPCECIEDVEKGHSPLQVFTARYESMYGSLQPFDGKLVYLAASKRQAVCLDDATFGWNSLLSNPTDIYEIPGAHLNMLNPPNVSTMANILSREMAKVLAQNQ